MEETISSEKTEKRSNMEKAEERRANMMQEILEEDLGEMKIRLIALEKKVDTLHPGGSFCKTLKIFLLSCWRLVSLEICG